MSLSLEHSGGPDTMMTGDGVKEGQMQVNSMNLLGKSAPWAEQAWLGDVSQSRTRCVRIQPQGEDQQTK